tara:strand:- start:149 stop:550 length:402 start_codon:yes stop_codon:yes gene_type:complete
MNRLIPAFLLSGYLLGLLLLLVPIVPGGQGGVVGWLLCGALELLLLKRRFAVLDPAEPPVAFAIVLAGGFLLKLLLLVGVTLIASFFQLFEPKPFLLAFLAALVWGETLSLILLHRRLVSGGQPEESVMSKDS